MSDIHSFLIHPSLGLAAILSSAAIFGALGFGFSVEWFSVTVLGLLSFTVGCFLSKFDKNSSIALIISEVMVFIVIFVSFRKITGSDPLLISASWLAVANASALLIKEKKVRFPVYSAISFSLGAFLVIHSFSSIKSIAELRSSASVPLEGAFGMLLIFISYPSLFDWLLKTNRILSSLFSVISIILMVLHGFRADAILVLLSTFLIVWRRNKKTSYAILVSVFLLYIAVDIIRNKLVISALERPLFRLSTTYFYSKELASHFFKILPIEPFWLTSVPLHPSQTIGRGIFGKEFGITPTIFVGILLDLGLVGVILLSFLLGFVSGKSYRSFLKEDDSFSYLIIWPILITRTEIGLTQLDLALIFGSTIFSVLLNFLKGGSSSFDGSNHAVLLPWPRDARGQETHRREDKSKQGEEEKGSRETSSTNCDR